jgi:hypothetical protein
LVTDLLLFVINPLVFVFLSFRASITIDAVSALLKEFTSTLFTRVVNYSFLWRTQRAARDYFRGNGVKRLHLGDRKLSKCYSLLWLVTVAVLRDRIM